MIKIAIDCMGGDHGLPVTLPAALLFRDRHPDTQILLVGLADQIESHLLKLKASRDRIEVIPATDVVTMEDTVEIALRKKKDSSMRVAANLVKDGAADACISAGNTGAWMAISRYVLKTIEGIDRPAIATAIPNQKGVATVLDLGANVDCSAEHLLQFAIMGSALSSAVDHVANPSVGLLNIGEEVIKGNDVVKQAAELLRQTPQLNFYGNVEGDDIYKGTVDVVVCDGFVGNVFLKSSEGLARMVGGFLLDEFKRNAFSYFLAFLALPVLNRFKKRVDHRRYNGAALLGLRGVVIKSHGSADSYAFGWALSRARSAVQSNMLAKISASVAQTYERLQPVLHGTSAEETHEINTDLAKKEEQ